MSARNAKATNVKPILLNLSFAAKTPPPQVTPMAAIKAAMMTEQIAMPTFCVVVSDTFVARGSSST